MSRALPSPSILLILPLLSLQAMAEEQDNDGYPAPPGVYGQAEILKNAQLNMGSGSPYVVIENNQDKVEPQTQQPAQNKPASVSQQYSFKQQAPQPPVKHDSEIISQPADQYIYQRPAETVNNYPDAKVIQKQYQEAKQYPFEQWGDMPVQSSGNYGPDYGSEAVPIDTNPWKNNSRQYTYPAYNNLNNINPDPGFSSNRMIMPFNNERRSQFYNPGNMMDQFMGNWGSSALMPPSSSYLQPIEQFPVPNMPPPGNMYGVPGSNQALMPPGSNVQFRPQIPEEDIIYPPSYPGKRR